VSKDLISLIVVNYNGARYLQALIDTLLDQSYKNYELIIWDNNSADHSTTLIENMHLEFITLVKHHQNIGFAKANNEALRYCRGDYIMLLNNDTLLHPRCLQELYNEIIEYDIVAPIVLFYQDHVTLEVGPEYQHNENNLGEWTDRFSHIIHNNGLYNSSTIYESGDQLSLPYYTNRG